METMQNFIVSLIGDKDKESEWINANNNEEKMQRCKSMVIFPSSMRTIPFTVPTIQGVRSKEEVSVGNNNDIENTLTVANTTVGAQTCKSMEHLGGSTTDLKGAYSLGTIDPSLYKMTDEDDNYDCPEFHIGRIWFTVEYERESEKLLINLIKARNLPSRTLGSNNGCDPFARIYLMPDERRHLQSRFKKKTCNPKFEESFVFQVSNRAIDERILKITIFDIDRHKRHNVIGHATLALKELDYENNERCVVWRDLESEVVEAASEQGEMHVSLAYNNHLQRLTVGVFEGKQFLRSDGSGSGDFYIKVCLNLLNKVVKNKKTQVVKKCTDPNFSESFTFKLAAEQLDTTSVTLTAMQSMTGQRDKCIGRLTLGSYMFARGKELEHWNEMLQEDRDQVTHWHTMT